MSIEEHANQTIRHLKEEIDRQRTEIRERDALIEELVEVLTRYSNRMDIGHEVGVVDALSKAKKLLGKAE